MAAVGDLCGGGHVKMRLCGRSMVRLGGFS